MGRTQEQKAADARLEQAIKEALDAYACDVHQGNQLIDYVVVVETVRFDEDPDGPDTEFVSLLYRHGKSRRVVVNGLLHAGLDTLGSDYERTD